MEGAIALEMQSMHMILIGKIDEIKMYNINSYEYMGDVPIKLMQADTREPN